MAIKTLKSTPKYRAEAMIPAKVSKNNQNKAVPLFIAYHNISCLLLMFIIHHLLQAQRLAQLLYMDSTLTTCQSTFEAQDIHADRQEHSLIQNYSLGGAGFVATFFPVK